MASFLAGALGGEPYLATAQMKSNKLVAYLAVGVQAFAESIDASGVQRINLTTVAGNVFNPGRKLGRATLAAHLIKA